MWLSKFNHEGQGHWITVTTLNVSGTCTINVHVINLKADRHTSRQTGQIILILEGERTHSTLNVLYRLQKKGVFSATHKYETVWGKKACNQRPLDCFSWINNPQQKSKYATFHQSYDIASVVRLKETFTIQNDDILTNNTEQKK